MKIFLSLITVFLYAVATQATVTTDSFDFEAEDRELHGFGRGGGFRGGHAWSQWRRHSRSRLLS